MYSNNNQINDNFDNQSCQSNTSNGSIQKILSIEIPKITVIVRKRPLNQKELNNKETDNITIQESNKVLDLAKYIDHKEFIFDKAYDQNMKTDKIYMDILRPMIFNAFYLQTKISCFAFGQTGSGKTFTMMGNNQNNAGIYMMAGYDIFTIMNNDSKFSNFKILASFYEIYCDKLFDSITAPNTLIKLVGGKATAVGSIPSY